MPDESSRAVSTTTVNGGKRGGGRPRNALGHFTQEFKNAIETTMRLLGDEIKGSDEKKQGGVIGYLMYLAMDKPAACLLPCRSFAALQRSGDFLCWRFLRASATSVHVRVPLSQRVSLMFSST